MNKKNAIIAAAAFAATFVSAPAFAAGRAANDGGLVDAPANYTPQQTSSKPTTPSYGRAANDGGLVSQPSSAQTKGAAGSGKTAAVQQPANPGRAANDGGLIQ